MITGNLQIKKNLWYAILNLYENEKRHPKWISTGLAASGNKRAANKALQDIISEYEDKSRPRLAWQRNCLSTICRTG